MSFNLVCSSCLLLAAVTLHAESAPETTAPITSTEVATVQDLRLFDVVKLAVATVPVELAKLERQALLAEARGARQALLPRVSAHADLRRRDTVPVFVGDEEGALTTYSTRLRIGQSILDMAARHRSRAANNRLAAGPGEISLAAKRAVRVAANQYLSLVSAQDRLAVRQADLILAQDLARQPPLQFVPALPTPSVPLVLRPKSQQLTQHCGGLRVRCRRHKLNWLVY